jgi:hypothetical protein
METFAIRVIHSHVVLVLNVIAPLTSLLYVVAALLPPRSVADCVHLAVTLDYRVAVMVSSVNAVWTVLLNVVSLATLPPNA